MTKSFDEWYFKQRYLGIEPIEHARAAFKAGAQSKQAEIDELRKRIEKTERWVESNKRNIPLSEWHGYTTEEYVDADDLLDILKGK